MRIVLAFVAVAVASSGCGGNDCCKVDAMPDADPTPRTQVLAVPSVVNRDVDILFMIDDSPSTLDKQTRLKTDFPTFINVLNTGAGGLPNVHIGVVTSDLGTSSTLDATPGPMIGSGPGSCSGFGKNGNLQTYGSTALVGNFISDIKNTDGTRTTNYTGSLASVFSAIASAGSAGCGFEQPLEAVQRGLDNNPANAGFLRPAANLAIVLLTDEDDCSVTHSSLFSTDPSLGPLQSFRCTQFGVTCDQGGATTDMMAMPGAKTACHSNEQSAYLTRVADHETFLKGLKADPRNVMVAALIGDPVPVTIELRAPPGGGTPVAALAHSCMYTDAANQTEVADPAVRVAELAGKFQHNVVRSICGELAPALTDLGTQINSLAGSPCLTASIAQPPDCVVTDETSTGQVTPIPACPSATSPCYSLVTDVPGCSAFDHLRLDVTRTQAASPDTVTVVRCRLP